MRITEKHLNYRIDILQALAGLNIRYQPVNGHNNLFIEVNHCPCPMIREGLTKRELYEALLVAGEILEQVRKK